MNQELRRWRKLEDRKCWRARARRIRKKSRGGSSGLSKAQALVEIEQQERGYQKEVAKVRKWWLEALEGVEKIVQPKEKLIVWRAEDQEQRRRERAHSIFARDPRRPRAPYATSNRLDQPGAGMGCYKKRNCTPPAPKPSLDRHQSTLKIGKKNRQ